MRQAQPKEPLQECIKRGASSYASDVVAMSPYLSHQID